MNIAVIGGAGKMGMWVARQLLAENMNVVLIDSHAMRLSAASSELKTVGTTDIGIAAKVDIVILAVPISAFEDSIKELSKKIKAGQKVIDVTSVKMMPVDVMHKYLPECLVLGAHPIFGPGAHSLAKQNVVLTPTTEEEQVFAASVRTWAEARGAHVEIMTPAEHDRLMGMVLGLSHFIAIVSGDTLLHQPELERVEPTSSVTFRVLMTLIGSVLSEDPALYAAIQSHLQELPSLEKDFVRRAKEWADLVEKKDLTTFATRMTELKTLMQQNTLGCEQAYSDMYRLDRKE
ncbi:MAG: prephenate dehydrogenase [Dehalococcoidia bacterium]|nr:prephenate dehydrogenase [Dehalococcoidia bacterium]